MRDNRVVSATCYLPLSDNLELSKELGNRHRAGLGVSEVSDSLTIIVSEETGAVSTAMNGKLTRNMDADTLTKMLTRVSKRSSEKPVKEKTAKEKQVKEKLVQEKPAKEATEPKKPARRGRRPKAQSNIAASFE